MVTATIQPTLDKERIQSLDILRGFAVLGILVMNIQSFSMISQAYMNPTAYGDLTGMNKWAFIFSDLFFNLKFMGLFSLMFGAGIILITEKAVMKTGRSAGLHYRRNFWLLILGLFHAHLIWYGDILVPYALCGFIVFLFRKKKARSLLTLGLIILAIGSGLYILNGISIPYMPKEAVEDIRTSWEASPDRVEEEIEAYRGSYAEQTAVRSAHALTMETQVFLFYFLWRVGGLMLIGMALYKWGILTAGRSREFYRKGFLYAFFPGLLIVIFGLVKNFENGWSFEYSMFLGSQYNYWGSILMVFSYICLIMMLYQSGILLSLKSRLAAVGRMALTNYLMQSIICIFIFYGIGLGLFGQVSRIMQLAIVFLICALQLIYSKPWLNHFFFGPFEWLWRSLTYRKFQPFRRSASGFTGRGKE
jgi:uncharacterized protein